MSDNNASPTAGSRTLRVTIAPSAIRDAVERIAAALYERESPAEVHMLNGVPVAWEDLSYLVQCGRTVLGDVDPVDVPGEEHGDPTPDALRELDALAYQLGLTSVLADDGNAAERIATALRRNATGDTTDCRACQQGAPHMVGHMQDHHGGALALMAEAADAARDPVADADLRDRVAAVGRSAGWRIDAAARAQLRAELALGEAQREIRRLTDSRDAARRYTEQVKATTEEARAALASVLGHDETNGPLMGWPGLTATVHKHKSTVDSVSAERNQARAELAEIRAELDGLLTPAPDDATLAERVRLLREGYFRLLSDRDATRAELRDTVAALGAMARYRDELRAELAGLRERAVILPDDWQDQIRYRAHIGDLWSLIESWRASSPDSQQDTPPCPHVGCRQPGHPYCDPQPIRAQVPDEDGDHA